MNWAIGVDARKPRKGVVVSSEVMQANMSQDLVKLPRYTIIAIGKV